tara:strand:- start:10 stop:297 length:288 start_codon:yes stop_codon:yes gene_type:complete
MANEIDVENICIFLIVVFVLYQIMKRGSCSCGGLNCRCNREYFTPLDTIQTSLDESINNPSCCISNTAGYIVDPFPVSSAAPGFSTISAYANPCN